MDKLRYAKHFAKLDIRWGYNNLHIKEGDEWKAAFRTNRGLYEPTVMFFGLCNSPSTFQRMMNDILMDLINEGHVIVYLDDILIFTDNLEEHRRIVHRVLQRLREHCHAHSAQTCCHLIRRLRRLYKRAPAPILAPLSARTRDWTPKALEALGESQRVFYWTDWDETT